MPAFAPQIVKDIVILDVAPFMVILLTFLSCFEVAGYFFFLASDQAEKFNGTGALGAYIRAWLDGGSPESLEETLGQPRSLRTPWTAGFTSLHSITDKIHWTFGVIFFVMTVIILTNLLIAMMSDRFTKVMQTATAEWRIVFARQCQEYYDATILPVPFNIIELVLNACYSNEVEDVMHQFNGNDEETLPVWGRHYLWPTPANRFDMHVATTAQHHHNHNHNAVSDSEDISTRLKRQEEKLAHLIASGTTAKHHALEKREPRATQSMMPVEIVTKSAIVIDTALAKELGVGALWKDGAEHSYVGYGVPVCIGGLGTNLHTSKAVHRLLQPFGTVLAVTFYEHEDGGWWALASFTTVRSAERAVKEVSAGILGAEISTASALTVWRLTLANSTEHPGHAVTGKQLHEHNILAEAASRRGHILCETAGAADVVGERCVAVILQCDGRVLLLRRSGVQQRRREKGWNVLRVSDVTGEGAPPAAPTTAKAQGCRAFPRSERSLDPPRF